MNYMNYDPTARLLMPRSIPNDEFLKHITVIKRDDTRVAFDYSKIERAVLAAAESCSGQQYVMYLPGLHHYIKKDLASLEKTELGITEIQTIVEDKLMGFAPEVARAYIEYRHEHDRLRRDGQHLYEELMGLVNATNKDITNENANKDANVFPVMRDLMAGVVSKEFVSNFLPKDILAAHKEGVIHWHDMDYSPFLPFTNCCLVDLKGMLSKGFRLSNAGVESPKSVGVACAVTAQIIAQVASHQYGGTTIANIDEVLEPYVMKSYQKNLIVADEYSIPDAERFARERTEKEVYDGIQAMEYEVNTLFSSNGQQPFVTFTFGMGRGWAAKSVQKAILNVRIRGIGKEGITPVFPKLVFFIEEGLNLKPEDPNYDVKQLALECASKRMYPDIISAKLNREITGSSKPVSPMGCRSFLSVWKDEEGNEVLDGRNNLGVVSLNLPRLGHIAQGDTSVFFNALDDALETAFKALMLRIERLKGVKAKIAPILYTEGAFGVRLDPEDDITKLFEKGRASISLGYIGLHELGLLMYGRAPIEQANADVQYFLQEVVRYLSRATARWKEETGWGFSLYATPSESLCYRFCRLDTERFGTVPGVTDKGYYTNSFHLDVEQAATPFEKINFEKPYPKFSSGGHITYVEFPNVKNNLAALERIWDYAIQNVPYFGTNTPVDSCGECGFMGEAKASDTGFECPECGNKDSKTLSVTRRVCGYLGSPNARPFNKGKQSEIQRRVKHLGQK